MKQTYIIRKETEHDYRAVEELTREAFWNQYVPGCDEHYFVHMMRSHPDFIPELAFVLELEGKIIGNIMHTRSRLVDEAGCEKQVLTFGPISILPAYQRQGYGKALIEHAFSAAMRLGYDTVVIFGNPGNYVSRGFRSSKKVNVCLTGDVYPSSLLVKELIPGALDGRKWIFHESPAGECCADTEAAAAFDATFPPKEKRWQPSQEEFFIHSHSSIVR
ncbi:MAG: N-acetyltransferase [Clostridia bacterium]|nr:N-acetyltransferase [Clostridia bacterium]